MMNIAKSLGIAVAFVVTVTAFNAAGQNVGPCNGVSGAYGKAAVVVGEDGKTVNVSIGGGRPNAYGTCSGNQLTVNFKDDRVIKGVFDGKQIKWDNNTVWTKQ